MAYTHELLPNKVFKIKNTASTSINALENTTTEVTTDYDVYNNPVTSTTITKNAGVTEQTKLENVVYENQASGPGYYIGRPVNKTTSVTHNGDTMTDEMVFTYNASHLVERVRMKGHNTDYLTEDNGYDPFGNLTSKTVTATGLAPRVKSFTYDNSGRFLISSTDFEGLVTSYTYDTNHGYLMSQTSPSNPGFALTTSYGYDVWGKTIRITDYLGKNINYVYNNNNTNGTSSIFSTGDDGSYKEGYYDQLGRNDKTGVKNSNGEVTYSTTIYDIYDRPVRISEPFTGSSPQQWNETTYDTYGRQSNVRAYTGQTTTIAYNGLTTTVHDGFDTKVTTENAIGNVVSATDGGGTIAYQYFANGNLKQSNTGGAIVAIEQDGWGRKTRLTDPSAGTYTYEYNALGELTKETTPKGNTTYVIDNFGKVTEKTISGTAGGATTPQSTTTFTYHPTSKLLTNTRYDDFTNPPSTLYHYYYYLYDNYNRLITTHEEGPNAIYEKRTLFDAFGRPEKELYSANSLEADQWSDKWVRNTYRNGYHWQILDDATGQLLWQANTVNERGQLTGASYGNGITVTNTYDQYGFPARSRHDKTAAVNVMTLNTTFEPLRGNLTSRYNSLFNKTETFQYDTLDRLTSFTNAKGQQEQQAYNNNGTIQSNSTGNYSYSNTQKPHRNTSVSLSAEAKAYYQQREGVFFDTMETKNGWETGDPSIFSFDDTFSHSGGVSLKINNPSAAEKYIHSEVWVPINNAVATEYTYSAWVYSNAPETQLFLFMKDGAGQITQVDNIGNNTVNQWTYVTKTVLVPASIKRLNLRLDNNEQGIVWFDDVKIRKTQNPVAPDTQRSLDITYNAFKSPVEIIEPGCDRISFDYNMANARSTMYYGGLQEDKRLRPLRKHYSIDGSMEIKHNTQTGETEFITYIGGDGYSAPVVLKSNGTTQEYLYLHRDYQGTILAITNQAGDIVEKRLFDAWGAVVKIQDGAGNTLSGFVVLDRGYTGHEHLQGVNLIHMNARLYDPVLHRFLQPDNFIQDPYNTQNYNRYGYVMNNPLKYTDPSGEEYNNGEGGGSGIWKSLIAAGIVSIGKNWDKLRIKEWANRNIGFRQFGDGVKSIVKSWSNGIRSIGRGIRRLFGERKRYERPAYVPLPPTPAISNHQLSSGWQNEGFGSSELAMQQIDPPVKMKPASAYDYSQDEISGKFTDDWNYILHGDNGNPFSRYGEIFSRDWGMSSTGDKANLVLSATPLAFVRVGSLGLKTVSFGRNANQTYHAFRHVDDLGLSRKVVINAIGKHLPSVISKVKVGQPLNVITKINNTRIQYTVYKLGNSYNIGRIHAAF
jgi:RHS repeat-associated protein